MIMLLIEKLAGLALIAGLGYYFGKRNLLRGEALSRLAWLVIDVSMPALFFCGVARSGFSFENKDFIEGHPIALLMLR